MRLLSNFRQFARSLNIDKIYVFAVVLLLSIQASLLCYSATRHSPTHLEPAFLASGISHWQLHRFELYRVNPPLVRMVSAIPVLAFGCNTDWSRYRDYPGSRAEFVVGEDYVKVNGVNTVSHIVYARWACIPFALIGSCFACLWAAELYGRAAGMVTLVLYVFEPFVLAHSELLTPDSACTAFGIMAGFTYWRWLKQPTWRRAGIAGVAMGLAQLSKMSWLLLYFLWPILWIAWRQLDGCKQSDSPEPVHMPVPDSFNCVSKSSGKPHLFQLALILLISVHMVNSLYGYSQVGCRLDSFEFVSTGLSSMAKPGVAGNRFAGSWIGAFPVPLPKQYVLGLDSQCKDLQQFGERSYLRGEWRDQGWWYYYVYGLSVKASCGVLGLTVLVFVLRLFSGLPSPTVRDELVLLLPCVTLLAVVSTQTEFSIHLRYVLPSFGMYLIFLGQCASASTGSYRDWPGKTICAVLLLWTVSGTLLIYPHQFRYFNELSGGSNRGSEHLLGSSFDWGQDWLALSREAVAKDQRIRIVRCVQFDYGIVCDFLDSISLDELTSAKPGSIAVAALDQELQMSIRDGKLDRVGQFGSLVVVAVPGR